MNAGRGRRGVPRTAVGRQAVGQHARHPDLIRLVHHGGCSGTAAGDGQPVRVRLGGGSRPLREVLARTVAVVVLLEDAEDKLIGVQPGSDWPPEGLRRAALRVLMQVLVRSMHQPGIRA